MTLPPMTDDELAAYLYPPKPEQVMKLVKAMTPENRAVYDSMRQLEHDVALWIAGQGPRPANVMIDLDRGKRRK